MCALCSSLVAWGQVCRGIVGNQPTISLGHFRMILSSKLQAASLTMDLGSCRIQNMSVKFSYGHLWYHRARLVLFRSINLPKHHKKGNMKQFKIEVSHASPGQLQTIAAELKIMSNAWTRYGPRIMINGAKLQAPSLTIPGSGRKRGPRSGKPQARHISII